jgi:hypothetical protein
MLNKGNFRYPFMVLTYAVQLLMGQSPLQGAQSTIYAATGGAAKGMFQYRTKRMAPNNNGQMS